MAGIQLGTNFDLNTALPLDSRAVFQTIAERDALVSLRRYEGMAVYVVETASNYQLIGGIANENWQSFAGGGGGGDCCFAGIVWDNVSSAPRVQEMDGIASIALTSAIQQGLYVKGLAGVVTTNAALFSSEPTDGTIILLKGVSDAEHLVIPVSDTDGGFVGSGDAYLKNNSTLTLVYSLAIKRYVEMGRSI